MVRRGKVSAVELQGLTWSNRVPLIHMYLLDVTLGSAKSALAMDYASFIVVRRIRCYPSIRISLASSRNWSTTGMVRNSNFLSLRLVVSLRGSRE